MTDWASWGTAVGTLVLAGATFASIRSANQAGRNAERALQVGLRPVLFESRPQDIAQKIRWGDGHWAELPPGQRRSGETELTSSTWRCLYRTLERVLPCCLGGGSILSTF